MTVQIKNEYGRIDISRDALSTVIGNATTECYGVADKQSNILVTDSTIFPAYSISKFVTALCVMKLYEKSLLDIDVPINNYLNFPSIYFQIKPE